MGLLLLRFATAGSLFNWAAHFNAMSFLTIPQMLGAAAGAFLLVGFWTPLAGATVAAVGLWTAFSSSDVGWISLLLATNGASLAMIGPGQWSVDASLFGRKRIEASSR